MSQEAAVQAIGPPGKFMPVPVIRVQQRNEQICLESGRSDYSLP